MERAGNHPDSKETEPSSKNILSVHFKLHGGDGISLQAQELARALSSHGWHIFECAGDLTTNQDNFLNLPAISYQDREIVALRNKIFSGQPVDDNELMADLKSRVEKMFEQIKTFCEAHDIRIIHLHNIFSLPYNPVATLAFYRLAKEKPDITVIAQHHDFIDEGRNHLFPLTGDSQIQKELNQALLPNLPNVKHVVLSQMAAAKLKARKNIDAVVIPDGFDFSRQPQKEETTGGFRQRFAIAEDDLVVGVMTRIVPRKAIELAIELSAGLNKARQRLENQPDGIGPHRRKFTNQSRIVLLLAQKEDVQDNLDYYQQLINFAASLGVTVINVGDHVVNDPSAELSQGKYRFYDLYQHLDVLCYPTTQEGFGNQLLEGVALARGLIPVMFEYPVFEKEIKPYIHNIISLGNCWTTNPYCPGLKTIDAQVMQQAVEKTINNLLHPEEASDLADENYRLAKDQYDINQIAQKFIQLYIGS